MKKKYLTHQQLHKKWMQAPEYAREYNQLGPEFQIAKAIIEARIKKGITQQELAVRASTGQAVISRLENMSAQPSLSLVKRVAEALGLRAQISFVSEQGTG